MFYYSPLLIIAIGPAHDGNEVGIPTYVVFIYLFFLFIAVEQYIRSEFERLPVRKTYSRCILENYTSVSSPVAQYNGHVCQQIWGHGGLRLHANVCITLCVRASPKTAAKTHSVQWRYLRARFRNTSAHTCRILCFLLFFFFFIARRHYCASVVHARELTRVSDSAPPGTPVVGAEGASCKIIVFSTLTREIGRRR